MNQQSINRRTAAGTLTRVFACCILIACSILHGYGSQLFADMLLIAGENQPVFGRYIENGAAGEGNAAGRETIIFQVHKSDPAGGRRIEVNAEQVVSLVVNIDEHRLGLLKPGSPESYRDYAEELAAQKTDPEARELAIRLYLIVVVSGNRAMRNSALAGLVPLARNPDERKKFEMLRFINAGGKVELTNRASDAELSPQTLDWLMELVQALSRGRRDDAIRLLGGISSDRVDSTLMNFDTSLKELQSLAQANQTSSAELLKLLTIEKSLRTSARGGANPINVDKDWATLSLEPAGFWVQLPTPAAVTEFEPAKNKYRAGQWISE